MSASFSGSLKHLLEENRHAWDVMAPIHSRGSGAKFYRMEEFLAGECKLAPWEIEEVGSVEGKSLLHLQCHIGMDSLSWARRGAQVTGVDFSEQSIHEASMLAEKIGVPARFVAGAVSDAVEVLDGETFDILYTGRGALCWLPDLAEWARVCACLVKPGGILYLEEVHPTLSLMKWHKGGYFTPGYDAFSKEAVSETEEGSYADRNAKTGPLTTHSWDYSLGELLGALKSGGFQLEHLHERDEICFEPYEGVFEASRPNYWTFKKGMPRFPLSYTLKMTRC